VLRSTILALDTWVARLEAALIALVVLALTGVTFVQVVMRYVFGDPLIWSEEAARYLFVWLSLIGAALALHQGGHYGLDALVSRLPPWPARIVAVATSALIAAFLVLLLRTGVSEMRQAALQSSATLPVGMEWPYLAIPLGAGLMLFHLLAHLVRFGPLKHPLDARSAPKAPDAVSEAQEAAA
jgi:TRAP-type C4-dicarboxylate transport system permease small subunit